MMQRNEQTTDASKAKPLSSQRRAMVLIGVLVVIVVLSLLGYQYADMMMSEYEAAHNTMRAAQARCMADSGINYAAAIMSDPNAVQALLAGNPFNNEEYFRAQMVMQDGDFQFSPRFSLVAPAYMVGLQQNNNGAVRFGLIDEGGKINLNAMMRLDPKGKKLFSMLQKLPYMTDDIAASIVDWLDEDEEVRENGAESSTYSGFFPPYTARNGPLDSIEELLLVNGVTPELLFGNDSNRNGIIDFDEVSNDPQMDLGWNAYLTIYSREMNIDSEYMPRINLNQDDLAVLVDQLTVAVGPELANFIGLYRMKGGKTATSESPVSINDVPEDQLDFSKGGRRKFRSLFDLVGTEVQISIGSGRNAKTMAVASPLNSEDGLEQLLPALFDKTTILKDMDIPCRININTAPEAVLMTLPDITEEDVMTISAFRPDPTSPNTNTLDLMSPAWILKNTDIPPTTLKKWENYITTRSQVYRVHSVGYFPNNGPVARVEAVIDMNAGRPRILYRRELSILGRGFDETVLGQ